MKVFDCLERIVKTNANSYHHLLREAYIQVPPMLLGSDWPDTQKQLGGHGISLQQLGDETVLRSRCVVRKGAFKLESGDSLDLYMEMDAPRGQRDQFGFPAPGRVAHVSIGLEGEVDVLFSEACEEHLFLEGTVLDAILQTESELLMDVVKDYPMLEYVQLAYGYAGDRAMLLPCWGFNVILTFASTQTPLRRSKLLFDIESGLDLGLATAVHVAKRDKLGRVREGKAYVEAGDRLLPVDDWKREFGDNFPGFRREDTLKEIVCSGRN